VNRYDLDRDDWVVAGLAVVLLLDLLLFPWFSVSVSAGAFSVSESFTAISSPDGWAAVIAVLILLVLLADLAVQRFAPSTSVPAIGNDRRSTRFALAVGAVVFVAIKFILHVHFSFFGWGFYFAVILSAALIYASLQAARGQTVIPARFG
jgi:hypothetical protein